MGETLQSVQNMILWERILKLDYDRKRRTSQFLERFSARQQFWGEPSLSAHCLEGRRLVVDSFEFDLFVFATVLHHRWTLCTHVHAFFRWIDWSRSLAPPNNFDVGPTNWTNWGSGVHKRCPEKMKLTTVGELLRK